MFLVLSVGEGRQHVGQRCEGQIKPMDLMLQQVCSGQLWIRGIVTQAKQCPPVFLFLGVGEGRQHVSQRCEGQIKIINIMLDRSKFVVPKFWDQRDSYTVKGVMPTCVLGPWC